MTKVCVVGLGYIGLPTAAILAKVGCDVLGVDNNPRRLFEIDLGTTGSELEYMVAETLASGRLRVQRDYERADVFIVCVGTPIDSTLTPVLDPLVNALSSIVPHLNKGNLVVIESTIPPLTTENVVIPILKRSGLEPGKDLYVAHCPERVIPGKIAREMVYNDRVIGGINEESAKRAKELYEKFVVGNISITDCRSAEVIKLMENTYRDVNIALANEFLKVGEDIGIDVWSTIELANKHPRVDIHRPGPGVGGHCIPVDPWFLSYVALPETKENSVVITSRRVNDSMPEYIAGIILHELTDLKDKPVVTIFGASYKPDSDDMRNSPSIKLRSCLMKKGIMVRLYDPLIDDPDVFEFDASISESDCVVIAVPHNDFKSLPLDRMYKLMHHKVVIDLVNFTDKKWDMAGFRVRKVGNRRGDIWKK